MQLKLYGLRKSEKLSQEKMSKLLGLSIMSYGAKERDDSQFTIDEMFAIANHFNLSINDIFTPRNQKG